MNSKTTRKKVLAVSNSGGHWVQLMRLRPAWDDYDVTYLTTEADYKTSVLSDAIDRGLRTPSFYSTVPASAWNKFNLIRQLLKVIWIVLLIRPNVIISTGASVGYFAFKVGKIIGAKTIWVDSIANVDELSLSGKKVSGSSDVWLTQWPHLSSNEARDKSKNEKPDFWGAVL